MLQSCHVRSAMMMPWNCQPALQQDCEISLGQHPLWRSIKGSTVTFQAAAPAAEDPYVIQF